MLVFLFAILALAMVTYMSLWFVYGFLYLKRIDSVDVAWGIGFIYTAAITLFTFGNYSLISLLSFAIVVVWGLRLSLHIGSRNLKKSEDKRYAVFREKYRGKLNPNIYLRIFLLQGLLILLISTAAIGAIIGENHILPLAWLGLALWIGGIVYESIADYQLRQFNKTKSEGQIMKTGLWSRSRHPNYFGEITTWAGAGIVAASSGNIWGLIGPLVLAYLIIKVSGIPPIEQKYEKSKDYQKYKSKTPALIPMIKS